EGISAGAMPVGSLHDISQTYNWGPRLAIGWREGNHALEVSGYWLPEVSQSTSYVSPPFQLDPTAFTLTGSNIPHPGGTILAVGSVRDALANQIANQVGQLTVPFFNAPAGFGGDNGIFSHADRIDLAFKTSLGNAEINYRYWPSNDADFQVLAG